MHSEVLYLEAYLDVALEGSLQLLIARTFDASGKVEDWIRISEGLAKRVLRSGLTWQREGRVHGGQHERGEEIPSEQTHNKSHRSTSLL